MLSRALFLNSESERAIVELEKLKDHLKNNASQWEEVFLKDLQAQIDILSRKIQIELSNSQRIGNINDAAYLSSSKVEKVVSPPQVVA